MSAFAALFESGFVLVPIVVECTKRRFGPDVDLDDAVSFAHEGLMIAARTFAATRGIPFLRWAKIKMRYAILEGIRSQGLLPRRLHRRLRARACLMHLNEGMSGESALRPPATADAADAVFGEHLAAMATAVALGNLMDGRRDTIEALVDPYPTPEESAAREELNDAVRRAIAELPTAERTFLHGYYFEGMTLGRAAGGLSRAWACRLHARAVAKVSRSLGRAVVKNRHRRSVHRRASQT